MPTGKVYTALTVQELFDIAVQRGVAKPTNHKALIFHTGKYTGRVPEAKYIVDEPLVHDHIWWGSVNRPFSPELFKRLKLKVLQHLSSRDVFVEHVFTGTDPRYQLPLTIISENPVHALFSRFMFIHNPSGEQTHGFTILHAPSLSSDPASDGTSADAFVIIHFSERLILIGGTQYAGEIKKSVFTVMNYLMPEQNVLPMHSSANFGAEDDNAALFFGLSGTGKTTLSAAKNRTLVGDDEHGWSQDGIFNFEGGCYAKVINLSPEGEPEIFNVTQRFGTLLENVVFDPTSGIIDLNNQTITENTRASYPITYMPHMSPTGTCGHPKNIIMLTCDAFAVLPPISKLNSDQALYHFISGYTAKVSGTEAGIKEPQATFSPCYGGPFMPRSPLVYAQMLRAKMKDHAVDTWLINTGWIGGAPGKGSRIRLDLTRTIIERILSGDAKKSTLRKEPVFGLEIPSHLPGIPEDILYPAAHWALTHEYEKQATALSQMFHANTKKLNLSLPDSILQSQPRL